MFCTVLDATPMAFAYYPAPSAIRFCVGLAKEAYLHSPATAPVWSVISVLGTELFPDGVETLFPCKAYLCKPCV